MHCPKCTGTLTPITIGEDINAHRCDTCFGLWSQPDELLRMQKEWMSEALVDVGNPKIGAALNKVKNPPCPLGHGPMQTRADPDQPHICFEECETCGGIFLDAGEFTDLKFNTLLDWLKARLVKRR